MTSLCRVPPRAGSDSVPTQARSIRNAATTKRPVTRLHDGRLKPYPILSYPPILTLPY